MLDECTKAVEKTAMWSAFNFGITDSDYSFDKYKEKIFRDRIVELQTKQHTKKEHLFYWIKIGALDEVRKMLEKDPSHILKRDVAGASPIHMAYLFGIYDLAHYLVERFPEQALLPYSDAVPQEIIDELQEPEEELKRMMPYTGETILHMVIVRRNREEVRWILDFFQDHKHTVRDGLPRLLNSNATGMFFDAGGDFYFGGYPLQFAVCANDKEIFDLVLAFASTVDFDSAATKSAAAESVKNGTMIMGLGGEATGTIQESKSSVHGDTPHFGSNVIFMRDTRGNTVLHLCALHCLQDMYKHVQNTAEAIINRELKIHYAKATSIEKKNVGDVLKMHDFDLPFDVDTQPSYSIEPRVVRLPIAAKYDDWLEKETRIKLEERLVLALNKDLHSPLTLAASQIVSDPNDTQTENKIAMLTFLLTHLKKVLWTFGPITCSLLNLEGVEIRHPRDDYPDIKKIDLWLWICVRWAIFVWFLGETVSVVWNFIFWLVVRVLNILTCNCLHLPEPAKRTEIPKPDMHYQPMYSAIEWLCKNDADQGEFADVLRFIH